MFVQRASLRMDHGYVFILCRSGNLKNTRSTLNTHGEYKVVPKVPYRFSYVFEDDVGKRSKLMIEDWETGMLYFNCIKRADGNEKVAISKVREKYYDDFAITKDLHFFIGTTLKFHNIAPNPFLIVGTFHPPIPRAEQQMNLFDT